MGKVAVSKTQMLADLLNISLEELENMSDYDLHSRVIEWWMDYMESVYDE